MKPNLPLMMVAAFAAVAVAPAAARGLDTPAAPTAAGASLEQVAPAPRTPGVPSTSPVPPVPPPPPPPGPPRTGERGEQGRPGPGEHETSVKAVKVGERASFVLSNLSGDIRVGPGPAGVITIETTRRTRGRSGDEARREMQQVDTEIAEHAGRVTVTTVYRTSPKRVAVDYKVLVPSMTPVELKSMSGSIVVAQLKGPVRAETMSGDVEARALGHDAALKSVSGDIDVDGITAKADVTVDTVSGDLRVRDVKARSLTVATVSGDIAAAGATCERVVASSVSGDVTLSGPLVARSRYEAKSHSGDLLITTDGKTGFEFTAQSFSGALHSGFALGSETDDMRQGRGRTLNGVYGDGSAHLELQTFSGDVTIVKR